MKIFLYLIIIFFSSLVSYGNGSSASSQQREIKNIIIRPEKPMDPPFNIGGAILQTKQIKLPLFPKAFNPSLIEVPEGFLLIFRDCPDPKKLWISHIGVVLLNKDLEVISEPTILKTRKEGDLIPPQGEDARIFRHGNKLYLIYNDNNDFECPSIYERRDMFIAELKQENTNFIVSEPLLLFHEKKYASINWQKNWVPFSWNDNILLSYSLLPHEILVPDCVTGECAPCYETVSKISWRWGQLRGGTPALLINGEYIAFFHSSTITKSTSSRGTNMWHYYMGAYAFSAEPPFSITKMTKSPIIGDKFYTISHFHKRVIFPGGFVYLDPFIYLAYGKDDSEMWVALIDYHKLKNILMPIDR